MIAGFSAGVSDFRPEIGFELYDALLNEDWERTRALRDICLPFQQFRAEARTNDDKAKAQSKKLLYLSVDAAQGERTPEAAVLH